MIAPASADDRQYAAYDADIKFLCLEGVLAAASSRGAGKPLDGLENLNIAPVKATAPFLRSTTGGQ